MQHSESLACESGDASLAEAVASGTWDELEERMRALCRYALPLTRTPAALTEADLAPLRRAGLDDRAIVDANQVVAYFNHVNRVADGLGVELEDSWPADRGPSGTMCSRAERCRSCRRASFHGSPPSRCARSTTWIGISSVW